MLRRLRCQEDLSFKIFRPDFGGDHRRREGPAEPPPPSPLQTPSPPPSPPSKASLLASHVITFLGFAVVVGFDRYFNYHKIQTAQLCINENPGCMFIATNTDAVTHLTDAQEWAGNGSMVGCIKGCTNRSASGSFRPTAAAQSCGIAPPPLPPHAMGLQTPAELT